VIAAQGSLLTRQPAQSPTAIAQAVVRRGSAPNPARREHLRGERQGHRSALPLHPLLAGSSFATPPAPPGVSDGLGHRSALPKAPCSRGKSFRTLPPNPLLLTFPRGAEREVPLNALPNSQQIGRRAAVRGGRKLKRAIRRKRTLGNAPQYFLGCIGFAWGRDPEQRQSHDQAEADCRLCRTPEVPDDYLATEMRGEETHRHNIGHCSWRETQSTQGTEPGPVHRPCRNLIVGRSAAIPKGPGTVTQPKPLLSGPAPASPACRRGSSRFCPAESRCRPSRASRAYFEGRLGHCKTRLLSWRRRNSSRTMIAHIPTRPDGLPPLQMEPRCFLESCPLIASRDRACPPRYSRHPPSRPEPQARRRG
jgi:hypothetical protein